MLCVINWQEVFDAIMNCLFTSAAGFISYKLCKQLPDVGHNVIDLDGLEAQIKLQKQIKPFKVCLRKYGAR